MTIIRSIAAVLAGLIFIIVTHTAIDEILEAIGILPSPEEGLHDPTQVTLALGYRLLFSVAGCYLAAYLAPSRPMLHALILGGIGLLASGMASIVVIPLGLSPAWHPIALTVSALPCGWAGGKIREKQIESNYDTWA